MLFGCSLAAGAMMTSDRPVFNKFAVPANLMMADFERERCLSGYYNGTKVEDLMTGDKKWGTANSKFGPWKVHTFIYYVDTPGFSGATDWTEHWYQYYDRDGDGRIDDCKYYKELIETRQPRQNPQLKETADKFKRDFDEYNRKRGYKF